MGGWQPHHLGDQLVLRETEEFQRAVKKLQMDVVCTLFARYGCARPVYRYIEAINPHTKHARPVTAQFIHV